MERLPGTNGGGEFEKRTQPSLEPVIFADKRGRCQRKVASTQSASMTTISPQYCFQTYGFCSLRYKKCVFNELLIRMNEIAKRKFTLDDIEAGYLCDTVHCGYITGLMHKTTSFYRQ